MSETDETTSVANLIVFVMDTNISASDTIIFTSDTVKFVTDTIISDSDLIDGGTDLIEFVMAIEFVTNSTKSITG